MRATAFLATLGSLLFGSQFAFATSQTSPVMYAFDGTSGVWALEPSGGAFEVATGSFSGNVTTTTGLVSNASCSDLIAWNTTSVWVLPASGCNGVSGPAFGTEAEWSSSTFSGSLANVIGDVNGDGLQDLVAWNSSSVPVKLSTGSSFGASATWSSGAFSGGVANLIGDVNGDGKADLIAWSSDQVWVELSNGSSFGAPTEWSSGLFSGNIKNVVGDVNFDGKADLISWNGTSVWVELSNGSSFGAPSSWSTGSFSGSVTDLAAIGPGLGVYLIAVDSPTSWYLKATGSAFNGVFNYSEGTFTSSIMAAGSWHNIFPG
jgi:hypothetical protein